MIAGDIVNFQIGNRGAGGISTNPGGNGGDTYINAPGESISAYGGKGSFTNPSGGGTIGKGGGYDAGMRSVGINGEDGQSNRIEYYQSNATTFLEATIGGKGGDAGNALHTGSAGGYRLYNATTATQIKETVPSNARNPGGGGAGHYNGSDVNCGGAFGIVIIHY